MIRLSQRKEILYALTTLNSHARQFNAVRDLLADYDKLTLLIDKIDEALRVPGAEYVPAIQDVFKLIDEAKVSDERTRIKANN